jgi:hypothetical protein
MVKFNLNTITRAIALAVWMAIYILSFRLLTPPTVCVIDSEHRLGDSLVYFNSSGRITISRPIGAFPPANVIPFTQVGHGFATFPPGAFFRCERLLDGEIVAVSDGWAPSTDVIYMVISLIYSAQMVQLWLYLRLLFPAHSDTKKPRSEDRRPDTPAPTPPVDDPDADIPPGLEGTMPK